MTDLDKAEREVDRLTPGSPPIAKRRGRPKGAVQAKRRKDPQPAPIDGDYQPLDVVNKKPGFFYCAMSTYDRQRRGHQFEVERWSEDCAHSPWETLTDENRGKEVKINGQLTLMRCPQERIDARRKRERDAHRAQATGLTDAAKAQGFEVRDRTINTHTINVSKSY